MKQLNELAMTLSYTTRGCSCAADGQCRYDKARLMDSAGSRERALAQYGRASLAIGRVSHAGGGGEERLARDCCRAFLQHCSSDPGGGCGTHGRRVGMAVRACRLPRLTPTCVSDTRALALAPQVREFMRVLDQRASANTAKTNAANKVNTINIINTANKVNVVSSGDGLATTAPGKVQNEPTSPPSTATPRVESEQTAVHVLAEDPVNDVTPRVLIESESDVEVETITEAEARGVERESSNAGDAKSRVQRAKQLLKDGDFLTAGQLLRSAANDGNGEACAIIGEILEQQNQHAAAANLLKVGYLFV